MKREKKGRCPICGHEPLILKSVDKTFEYGSDEEKVTIVARNVPVETCEACGETFNGPQAALVEHEAICRALGLLTPDEIRAIRERFGTQAEFAQLTGSGDAAIARWESGRLLHNKAMDRYLRLLAINPTNHKLLQTLQSRMMQDS